MSFDSKRAIPAILLTAATMWGCGHDPLEGDPVILGEEVVCNNPVSGFQRFTTGGASDGVTATLGMETNLGEGIPVGVGVTAIDGDGDGDIDLFFPTPYGAPQVFENDGTGQFTEVEQSAVIPQGYGAAGATFLMADFTGDGLPDVMGLGHRIFLLSKNLGDLQFGAFSQAWVALEEYVGATLTAAAGDADGDGDLDLLLPGIDAIAWDPPELGDDRQGSIDRLLINRGRGHFEAGWELIAGESGGLSMTGLFTDRDQDGDLDLLLPSISGHLGFAPTAFYRNEVSESWSGGFVEDGAELNADLPISGMGIDSADLNEDGRLDYCISDLNAVRCLVADRSGGYYEAAASMGITVDRSNGKGWSGWSIDLVDLDNDANLDIVTAAGTPFDINLEDGLDYAEEPDVIWQGSGESFEIADMGSEFKGADEQHYGLVTADLNGDGFLEIVAGGMEGSPIIWWNRCNESSWVEIDLKGLSGNTSGFGARVEIDAKSGDQVRELHSLRGFGQGPDTLHFGLGDVDEIQRLKVIWPDGASSETFALPVNRRITVEHPELGAETTDTSVTVDTGETGDTGVSGYGMISGEVTANVEPTGDGEGWLYLYLFEEEPQPGDDQSPFSSAAIYVDYSQPGASYGYEMFSIPAKVSPYYLTAYFDDDDSGERGPNSGDLIATPKDNQDLSIEIHAEGEYILNAVLNEVNP